MRDLASMEMATSKQRPSVLTLEKKIEIIRKIEKGKFQRRVAEIFEWPKSTVGDIWKDQLTCLMQMTPTVAKLQCIVHGSQFRLLDDALSVWVFLPSEI